MTVYDPSGIAAGRLGPQQRPRRAPLRRRPRRRCSSRPSSCCASGSARRCRRRPVGALLLAEDEAAARELLAHYSQFPELEPVLLDPARRAAEEPLLADGLWGCLLHTGYPISPLEATTAVAERARAAGAEFVLGEPVELARAAQLRPRGRGRRRAPASATLLDGLVPPDVVKPLWGVIVLVELPERPAPPDHRRHGHPRPDHGQDRERGTVHAAAQPELAGGRLDDARGDRTQAAKTGRRVCSNDGTRFVPSIEKARRPSRRWSAPAPNRLTTARSSAACPARSGSGSPAGMAAAGCRWAPPRGG